MARDDDARTRPDMNTRRTQKLQELRRSSCGLPLTPCLGTALTKQPNFICSSSLQDYAS